MRRAVIAVASVLAACGPSPRLRAPVDPTVMRAGEGRVAVRVESSGGAQGVAVVPRGTPASQGGGTDPWCTTPCTLHLAAGDHLLWTGSPASLDAVTRVRVGPHPLRVGVRASSRALWERGRNLLVGGIGLAVLGGIFAAFSPLEVTGGSPTGWETVAVGAGLAGVGTTLIVFGLRGMDAQHPGAEVTEEGTGR